MLRQEKPPSLTEYRVNSGTERPRHVQWSKLSKKRKRKLVQRNLKHLERKAKKKSLSFGLDDYSHVASLVFSQLPYNPNGHHCSCNCIDEILEAPDLAIDGLSYGKRLADTFQDTFDNENAAETRRCRSEGDSSCITPRRESRSQASRGNGRTSAITDLGVSPRQVCHKCKDSNCIKNILKAKIPNNRRLSTAKEDGSLRSKIYGLRKKIRQYTDQIDDRERKTVQAIVNRRYSIAEQQQLQALKLSDELRALKVKEMFCRSENAQLKERMTEKGDTWRNESTGGKTSNQIKDKYPDSALKNWLENVKPGDPLESAVDEDKDSGKSGGGSYFSGRRLSNRSNGRMSIAYQLPAVIEEEEEVRNSAEFWKDAQLNNGNKSMSYDILWINHNDDDVDEEENDEEEDDVFSKTWPMLPKQQQDWVFPVEDDLRSSRSAQSNVTFVKREAENLSPVKRLVHRLDSGLTFGFSSPTRHVLDKSLIGIKNKIDDEKLAGSKLPEEQYYKPLNERQTSFGSSIRKTIRDEILRRGSLASERRNSAVSNSELESEDKKLRDEVTRRRSLVVDERNVQAFVKEAERKDKVVKDEIRRRSIVSLGVKGDNVAMETDKSDSSEEISANETDQEEIDDDAEEKEGHENAQEDKHVKQNLATIAGKTHVVPNTKLYDLSTLKTVAQKHQTLRTLARLDEDLYKVSDGTEKLNTYRKNQAKAKMVKDVVVATPRDDEDAIPMTRKERIFSIPEPMNSRLLIESDIADNEKVISQLDFKYDMIRDLRFLVMNQNTSREFSYSYLKAAPPYLKTKWETRIKRGFLRGVKEQKINEKQLETVEGVTYKVIDRDVIHSETLKRAKGKRKNSDNNSSPESRNSASRVSASRNSVNRRSSSTLSTGSGGKGRNYKLPPLQLPGSRTPSPIEPADIDFMQTSKSAAPENLPSALKKLSIRHKFQEKGDLMRNVIRLSAYERNFDNGDTNGNDASLSTNRTTNGNEAEERYTPRLNTGRRQSTFVQNVASSDPQSGRVSVNSYDTKRRISQMQAIEEY